MGEHKGSGLALMCELLGGVLVGSGTSGPEKQRFANGMVSIYLSPAAFGSAEEMAWEARTFVAYVRSSRPANPGQDVLIPGDPERHTREKRSAEGIPLPDGTWDAIRTTAERLGVAI
jgi:uncharacterized oxidoreductase